MLRLEAGHGAHAIGKQHQTPRAPPGVQAGQVLDDVLGGGAHAVAAGLACDEQQVCAGQLVQQMGVQGGVRVGRVGYFGLHGAVVLGPGAHALEDGLHGAQAMCLPVPARGQHVGMHAMAPAADFAMHGPDHEGVTALGFQRVQVVQCARQHGRVTRRKCTRADLRSGDGGEGRHRAPVAALPVGGVRHVVPLVRVEGDGDVVDTCPLHADERCQALHVRVRAGNGQRRGGYRAAMGIARVPRGGQVAEVVLGINGEQVNGAGHGADASVQGLQCRQLRGRIRPAPLFDGFARGPDTQQREHHEQHGQYQEHHEQHLGDGGRASGHAGEPERAGNERNDGEDDRVLEHGIGLLGMGRRRVRRLGIRVGAPAQALRHLAKPQRVGGC